MFWFIQLITLIVLFGKIHNEGSDDSPKLVNLVYQSFVPIEGVTKKIPVIFLHGITSSKESWADLPQRVADATGRKVYAIDARNHGESPWTDQFDFDLNALDFNLFMNNIKADKAILIGYSMGGITSMKTALKWPNRIEKVIIEDMTAKMLTQDLCNGIKGYLQICQNAVKRIPPGTTIEHAEKEAMDIIFSLLPDATKSLLKPSDEFRLPLKKNYDGSYSFKTNFKVLIEKLKDVKKLYPEIKNGTYEGPACFIFGKNSPIQVWNDKDLIKGFFPKAEFIGIEGASHGVHSEKPAAFREKLFNCLKK